MPTTQREIRYLTAAELVRLRRLSDARALQARERDTVGAVRAWAFLDTLLSSGLRAPEVAALRIGDCLLGYGETSLVVRHRKSYKEREVFIPEELKRHLKAFITWKRDRGEDVSDPTPACTGQRELLIQNGVWRTVKRLIAAVGLDPRYATHSCRHSYATLSIERAGST